MTSQTNAVFSAQPGNTYLDGIWWNTQWVTTGNTQTVITYAPSATYAPNAAEIAAYTQIFADISAVCNITFVLGNAATADIVLNSGTGAQMAAEMGSSTTALGIADPPGTYIDGTGDEESWVFINNQQYSSNALNKGGYDYITWLHEIGHALGLAHPHDDGGGSSIFDGVTSPFGDFGDFDLNQGIYTTMSYNDGYAPFNTGNPKQFGWQATMMAFDVAALQLKYGANMNTATGDNFYVLSDTANIGSYAECIWDAGGSDWMYYGGAAGVVIDLRPATLTTGYGAGGFLSYVGSNPYKLFTIAYGVTIENAWGGLGNDFVIGNESANAILSFGGGDSIYGLGGNDYIDGGAGNDRLYGGGGVDVLAGGLGNDYFWGEGGTDYIYLSTEIANGEVDYMLDFVAGQDFFLLPIAMQGSTYYFASGASAYGYVALAGGGYYLFGVSGVTPQSLQASTFFF